jgi:hypothetical protein
MFVLPYGIWTISSGLFVLWAWTTQAMLDKRADQKRDEARERCRMDSN